MAEIKFEDALKKLEDIVNELEHGDLSLDDSLSKYEEGVKLSIVCTKKLEAAKQKIELLVNAKDGSFSLEPFNGEGLDGIAIKKGRTKRSKKGREETLL